jgi:RimJ/RimL family protein N-acetyltransferase
MTEPLLRDFPESFESERLLLRAPRPGDGAVVNAAVVESFDALHAWVPWARDCPTLEESEVFVRQSVANWRLRSDLPLLLFRKEEPKVLVGMSGLTRMDWSVPRFEIGYWTRTRCEKKGYATEASRAIAAFAFDALGARRVEIHCDAGNAASARVAERAGFVLEARLKNHLVRGDGRLSDTLIYARTT